MFLTVSMEVCDLPAEKCSKSIYSFQLHFRHVSTMLAVGSRRVKRQLEDQNAGIPMDFDVEQWRKDWKKRVALPKTAKSTTHNSFYCLEGIHIFFLAIVLRRPRFFLH